MIWTWCKHEMNLTWQWYEHDTNLKLTWNEPDMSMLWTWYETEMKRWKSWETRCESDKTVAWARCEYDLNLNNLFQSDLNLLETKREHGVNLKMNTQWISYESASESDFNKVERWCEHDGGGCGGTSSAETRKWHAAVARSTFSSQHAQKTSCAGPLCEVQMSKSGTPLCGAKPICKSKCSGRRSFGPLFEVQMSKNVKPLWREAHLQVKMR